MNDSILGQLIDEKAQRDAIHIAIAPVTAAELLHPGDHVGFVADGVVAKRDDNLIGIVDPFLMKPVAEGQRFWLCLYQKTVTGMRHQWEHPAFVTADASKSNAEKVIRKWLEQYSDIDPIYPPNTFERLVNDWLHDEIFILSGFDTPDSDETDPIKIALAAYTGHSNPDFFFSCTC